MTPDGRIPKDPRTGIEVMPTRNAADGAVTQRVCERGYLTPILFKSYALYTTRGAVTEPTHYIDWFLPVTDPS